MALVINDRVRETSTTSGTGTLNLAGAVTGFRTFVSGIGDGNTTYYAIFEEGTNSFIHRRGVGECAEEEEEEDEGTNSLTRISSGPEESTSRESVADSFFGIPSLSLGNNPDRNTGLTPIPIY